MQVDFTEEQEQLRHNVRRFVSQRAPLNPYVRSLVDTGGRLSREIYRELADIGVNGLLVPERFNGSQATMADMGAALLELGRALFPGPVVASSIGAVAAVVASGAQEQHSDLLRSIAEGSAIATVALPPSGGIGHNSPTVGASSEHTLSGNVSNVPDAEISDYVVVAAKERNGLGLYVVEKGSAGMEVISTPTVDETRRVGNLVLDTVQARRLGQDEATEAIRTVADKMLVAMVVEGVGAAEALLEMTISYASVRQQFGRPIGSFQAVQHLCADMLSNLELSRASAYYGLWAADSARPEELHRAAVMTKAFSSRALFELGAAAIQVHGGIGFTWEHDSHLYYKRLLSLQHALGSPEEYLEELATIVL
jgi:alkylation response protein AidB-like acyl-CoA dehydrogenase